VTLQVALIVVSATDVAVIVALPSLIPETDPLLTRAMLGLFEDHVTLLFAPVGEAVTVRFFIEPTLTLSVALLICSEVGGTGGVTVNEQKPLIVLLTVDVAVIVAVPSDRAVTSPLDETVATVPLLVDHVTELLAPEGRTLAVRVWLPPIPNESEEGLAVIDSGSIVSAALVPLQIRHAYEGLSIKGLRL